MFMFGILASESMYWQKSKQQCFQTTSSCPFCMSVRDHGDPHGALDEWSSAWRSPLVISQSRES